MKKFLAIVLAVAMMATVAVSFSAVDVEKEPSFGYEETVSTDKVMLGTEDNTEVYAYLTGINEEAPVFDVYAGTEETYQLVVPSTIKAEGLATLGLTGVNSYYADETYAWIIDGITDGDAKDTTTFEVIQTSGQGIATVTGSYDKKTNTLTIKVVSNPFAAYVDVRQVGYQIVATNSKAYGIGGNVLGNAVLGIGATTLAQISGNFNVIILPNYFTAVEGTVATGVTFSGGTTWGQLQTVAYSEALKGAKVSFKVMDMATWQGVKAAAVPNSIKVSFDKFALTEAVNFVYKSSYTDADYKNVLAVVDFQAVGRIFNDVGYVTIGNVGALGGFNFTGYNTGDKFNVYFDGKLIEEGVGFTYDAVEGTSALTFKLYNPTSTTSMLGKYVIAKAPVVVEEKPTANPEMGADSMINVAVALAAVSLAAAGFVAVKKSK